jgi:sigma-54 dependent transcriptional regulator, acetoin dehydrogenase operon transcriptional activator AcoR
MSVTVLTDAVHANRVMEVVRRHHSGTALLGTHTSELVARSWSRCINDYRLDPLRHEPPGVLQGAALRARLEAAAEVLECARIEMTSLYQQLADSDCAVVLAGTDGVILHMVASPDFAREVLPLSFCVGGLWSEREAGTNGMGTCVVACTPVAVRQHEHFFTAHTHLTCSAVPIYGPDGEVCAVLDVTSRSAQLQQHSLALLGMTAPQIENRLLDICFRDHHPVRFHSRPEFVYSLHEGRLVVDGRGAVQAANRSALVQLGFQTVGDLRQHTLEDIFETTLDNLLQRSRHSSFHPVATYRARVSNRFFVVAQHPAADQVSARPGPAAPVRPGPPFGASDAAGAAGATAAPVTTAAPWGTPASQVQDLQGGDARVAEQFQRACRVIRRGIPVLMHGETGSGKEHVARAVHQASPFASGPFIAVNCASLPETLIESELFGYRAGAFTGAQKSGRRGLILQAARGTLFLDEIGDMPLSLQARLLRVLDERRITPLGSEESVPVEFQLISASHRDLGDRVAAGEFREDLFYRINGLTLELPPLRERADRLMLIREVMQEESGGDCRLTPDAEMRLGAYTWPGNLRQLRHVMRTLAALFERGPIDTDDIPPSLLRLAPQGHAAVSPVSALPVLPATAARPAHADRAEPHALPSPGGEASTAPLETLPDGSAAEAPLGALELHERELMLRTLEQHRWNISHVAKSLNVSRNTVYRRLHRLRIDSGPVEGDPGAGGG